MSKQILVIGGGITGLSAAYYVQEKLIEQQMPYRVHLIEANDRLGGKIDTVYRDGFIIERGPDSFLARKQAARKLIEKLGLQHTLVHNATGQAYILIRNQLHKIPQGSFMGIPTEVRPFLFSSLLSLRGKVRASFDYVLPKGKAKSDQSLGEFFRRRFGNELVDHLIDPLLSGVYSGNIDEMSLMSTFPHFYDLEQNYRSLIKGLRKVMPRQQKNRKETNKNGAFLTLTGGFSSLVVALERRLHNIITTGVAAERIMKKTSYYDVVLSDGTSLRADAIIITTPHQTVKKLFSQYDEIRSLVSFPNSSVANVALAFDHGVINNDMSGTGFVVSRNSNFRITATTWTEKKWPHTTPKGKTLLRSYVGGAHDPDAVTLTDEQLVNIVMEDLHKLVDIKGDPLFSVVSRFEQAMPQYVVGHQSQVEAMNKFINEELHGITITGSSFSGVGVPDCIEAGKHAARRTIQFLQQHM